MLALGWRVAAGLHTTLKSFAPTNRLAVQLRTPHERPRARRIAACAIAMYVITAIVSTAIADGGPGGLHGIAGLGIWNAMKLAWAAALPVRATTALERWR